MATLLGILDEARTTVKRLDAAKEIISLDPAVPHPIDKAKQACSHHVAKWNGAAHGNEEVKSDLKGRSRQVSMHAPCWVSGVSEWI
ncbi:hypothetical protein NKH18_26440 [Streptomyces sp. M10(2022)]